MDVLQNTCSCKGLSQVGKTYGGSPLNFGRDELLAIKPMKHAKKDIESAKKGNTFRGHRKGTSFLLCMHMCVENLCGGFLEQRHAEAFALDSVAEFFDVESEGQQEKLRFRFGFSSGQEPPEPEILFDHAECAFHLDRTVHPQQNACFGCDPFLCFAVLFLQFV